MSQKQIKRQRKEFRNLFEGLIKGIANEPFRYRLKVSWSLLTGKNYLIKKELRK